MSATPAILAANSANITANNARIAAEARAIAQCQEFMPKFDPTTASTTEKQQYAHCVELVYPPPHDFTGAKGLVAMLLAAAIVGAVWGGARDGEIEGAFMGAVVGLFGTCVLALIVAAIAFVVS